MTREYFLHRVIVCFLLLVLAACTPNAAVSPEPSAESSTGREEYTASGDEAIEARSADGQAVTIDITLIFEIEPENIEQVRSISPEGNYLELIIRPSLRAYVREQIAQYTAQDLYMGSVLETLDRELEQVVKDSLIADGFTVIDVLIRNIAFSDNFVDVMEAMRIATLSFRNYEELQGTATQATINLRNAEASETATNTP